MKVHRWEDVRRRYTSAKRLKEIDDEVEAELLEMNMAELRKSLGRTQVAVAKKARVAQSEVSATESRADHLLSSLRRYVKALGGDLEVFATFPHKRVRLKGV